MEYSKMDTDCIRDVVDGIMQTVAKSHPESSTDAKLASDYASLAFFAFCEMGLQKLSFNERVDNYEILVENFRVMAETCAEKGFFGLVAGS